MKKRTPASPRFSAPPIRRSRVLARWRAGRPALCTVVQITDASVTEIVSRLGYDCVWLDLEHGAMSVETAANLMRVARQGDTDVLARPAKGEFMRLGRLLEAGASGILYPRCESAAEAREVVRWAKFAPLGERGFAGGNPDAGYAAREVASYVRAANRETFVCVQIESPHAVAQARAIAEVKGVDALFFGPGDYSILSGRAGGAADPAVWRACVQTAKAARAAGKRFATVTFGLEHARRLLGIGATFLHYGHDIRIMGDAYLQMREDLVGLGFRFGHLGR